MAPPIEHEITIKKLIGIIVNRLGYSGDIIYDTSYSNGQLKKTVDSSEINKYISDFEFTELENGLRETISFFCKNYKCIRK